MLILNDYLDTPFFSYTHYFPTFFFLLYFTNLNTGRFSSLIGDLFFRKAWNNPTQALKPTIQPRKFLLSMANEVEFFITSLVASLVRT